MGVEKGGSKGSGFFHLFDWNRKSRKKLFTVSPEGTKLGKRIDETIPSTRLRMIDEDDLIGISSIKGSSDYSCASSVTDDDLAGSKAPGVVARLMGLDTMPVSSGSEPYCTPFRDTRSFRENYSLKRSPENNNRDPLTNNQHRIENSGYMRKPVDLRAQKMPSSPIERFQMEGLPPRSAKPLPMTYHKLLSPIKNPGFTSARNAAQIMEAAAKILEPRLQSVGTAREKVCSFGSGRVGPYPKESFMASQRTSRLLQMSQVPVESGDTRFARGNREEDIVIFRPSPDPYEVNLGSTSSATSVKNNKGKSVSLAIQAKVNVQKREGVNLPSRHSGAAQKEHDDSRLNQAFRGQSGAGNSTTSQRNSIKQQKKQGSSSSSVLRQNNQKQNCSINRSKSGTSKLSSSQQGRKGSSCESSSSKHKSLSRLANNSKSRSTNESEKEASVNHNKDFPQKKRLIERNTGNPDKQDKSVRQNVVIDEFTKWNKEMKDTTDVVSFTFTSPLAKQVGDVKYQILGAEKLGLVGGPNGDALSLLLEQKLRELTTRIEPSTDFGRGMSFASLDEDSSAKAEEIGSFNDGRRNGFSKDGGIFNFTMHQALQVVEKGECSSAKDVNSKEYDQLSPLSVLEEETFVTNESCCTSEDSTCSDGGKISPSSVQAQNTFSSSRKVFFSETETKLADSACSALTDASKFFDITPVKQPKAKTDPELDYISDILSNTELERKALHGTQLDSPLFDKLERKRGRSKLENETLLSLSDRRLLFDCVNECLDSRIDYHFKAGYEAWSKGTLAVKKGLHKRVHEEISGWKNMADLNVDDIVEKDMGTGLGTWMDFRVEAFEAGTDLEAEILNSLIDEVFCDIIKG
ncbi:hypothetical protein LUZ61_003489 [Rhynchospora tenuis]|uniref:DUF4378 domain-containing protein n=1 Tax=Rhynchospora tenuis TaxID=198213 RepID=A0AAD5ZKY9_9POAL|nr:hypothetical protein LUZ61_003489 [Rhynchospora tenuis]